VFILSKLLIALISFLRPGVALYTLTAYQCTYSQPYDVTHSWYAVPQCRPLDSGCLKYWLQLASHLVIWGSIFSSHSQQTAIGKLKIIKHVLQIYGLACSSMLAIHLWSLNYFWNHKRIGDRPDWKRVVLLAMPDVNQYCKQWPTIWLFCSFMTSRPMLN